MDFKISYDCENLIAEIKEDILEFGEDTSCYAFHEVIDGHKFLTNYDLIVPEMPLAFKEIKGGVASVSTLKSVLCILEEQNSIF